MSVRNIVKSIQDIMRQDVGVDGDAQRISQLCWMFFLKIIDDQDQELELMKDGYASPIPKKYQWRTWAADPEGITGDELLSFVNDELFPTLKELPGAAKDGRRRVVRDVFQDAYNYMKSGQLMRQVVNKITAIDFNNLKERQHFGDIYEQILNDLQSAGNAGEYYTPRAVTAFMANRIDPKPGEVLFDPACGTGGFLTCAIAHMRERYVKKPKDEQKMQQGLRATEKKQLPHMLCVTNMLLHGIDDPSFVLHDNTLAKPYISYGQADRVIVDIITLDSEACAPCQYMVEAVKKVAPEFEGLVEWREHKIKYRESLVFMNSLMVRNVPTICIDGIITFVSRIPARDELVAAIQKRIYDKVRTRIQRRRALVLVLGDGGEQCQKLQANVETAIAELGAEVEVRMVTDELEILRHGVSPRQTPVAVVAKYQVKSSRRVPETAIIKEWIKDVL